MRRNDFLLSIFSLIKSGDNRRQLRAIYLFSIINAFLLQFIYVISLNGGTETYFSAGNVFWNGGIDFLRTPVYPIICHIFYTLSSQYVYYIISLFQFLIFLLSIKFFYKLCKILIESNSLIFITTLFYAVFPFFISWTMDIITESLSLSLFIIACYYILKSINEKSLKLVLYNVLFLSFLIFIRPIFIYVIPVEFLIWLYLIFIKREKFHFINICGTIVVVLLYLGYCNKYKQQYGMFTTSEVGYENQYCILRENNIVDYSYSNNLYLKHDIDSFIKKGTNFRYHYFGELTFIIRKYGFPEANKLINYSIKAHKKQYVFSILKRIIDNSDKPCWGIYLNARNAYLGYTVNNYILQWFSITFMSLYFLLLSSIIIFLAFWKQKKKFPLKSIILWLLITMNLLLVIVGAQDDYFRLILPSSPFILILLFELIDKLLINISFKEKINFI